MVFTTTMDSGIELFRDEKEEKSLELFVPVEAVEKPETVVATPNASAPAAALPAQRRGVMGEQFRLAKGHGLVWEIRRARGRERVQCLGWTREQLAFVLKLNVVGAPKMEHLRTSPVKSLKSRRALLGLAKTLENPSPETADYIEAEKAALGSRKAPVPVQK